MHEFQAGLATLIRNGHVYSGASVTCFESRHVGEYIWNTL